MLDAVCISRDNLQARSKKVEEMGIIIKQAAKVITWLGEADGESGPAFSLLQGLKDCLQDRSSFFQCQ